MRLIFFARDLEIGGVERALVNLLNALADRHAVTLVLEDRRGALLPELDGRVTLLAAPRCLPGERLKNAARLALWALWHARRYDFACAYGTDRLAGSRMARLASKNNCLVVHNDYSLILPDSAAFSAFFRCLRAMRFRRLVFVSRESRAAFVRREPKLAAKTLVIGNLAGAARLRSLAAEFCPFTRREGETVFLFLGRLDERQKRLHRLLTAFRMAHAERGDLRLLLVGDGPARADCEAYLRAHALEESVTLFGAQPNPYPFLAAADCLVLASDFEGFPLVCQEALALGRDVMSTVAVSDEQLDLRRHAVLCEKNTASLAAAMAAWRPQTRARLDFDALDRARLRAWEALF